MKQNLIDITGCAVIGLSIAPRHRSIEIPAKLAQHHGSIIELPQESWCHAQLRRQSAPQRLQLLQRSLLRIRTLHIFMCSIR